MTQSNPSIAPLVPIALAALFPLAGNLMYDGLLAALIDAEAGSVSFITDEPNGVFAHRSATLASFGFLGFSVGAALVACRRRAQAARDALYAYLGLALIAGGASALCFVVLHARATAFTGITNDTGIRVALPLEDIPLYPLGVFPGLCVLAYAAVLLLRGPASRRG
ncbi:hypothetical protein Bsp3421_006607 [Burkholderia sp. FERM BP-3421]|uniref:hypothetical protein n=1 Tax=Burkholderia sp. FERM BP-3421 TaxID=1494466 RepID=UPI00235E0AB0|nr:hypothetical protein [Burkholderia sp. FERM BP-3421]WDD96396.1 hypothetical protein Bsp3421_006607 [Burkholderia sp. FERM BP-3421]